MDDQNRNRHAAGVSRRNFLGVTSTALATTGLVALAAHGQEQEETRKAEADHPSNFPDRKTTPCCSRTQIRTCHLRPITEILVQSGIPSIWCTSACRKAVGHMK